MQVNTEEVPRSSLSSISLTSPLFHSAMGGSTLWIHTRKAEEKIVQNTHVINKIAYSIEMIL